MDLTIVRHAFSFSSIQDLINNWQWVVLQFVFHPLCCFIRSFLICSDCTIDSIYSYLGSLSTHHRTNHSNSWETPCKWHRIALSLLYPQWDGEEWGESPSLLNVIHSECQRQIISHQTRQKMAEIESPRAIVWNRMGNCIGPVDAFPLCMMGLCCVWSTRDNLWPTRKYNELFSDSSFHWRIPFFYNKTPLCTITVLFLFHE